MRRETAFTHALFFGAIALSAIHCAVGARFSPFAPDTDAGPGTPATPGAVILVDSGTALGPVPDAASPLDGCATATDQVRRSPIAMLVVLDASGSMNDDDKWVAVVPALEGFIDDIASRKDPSFGVGLTIFSDTNDPTKGVGPYPAMDVPIAYVDSAQASALHGRLDNAAPLGPTPTLEVLVGQYGALEAFTPETSPLSPSVKKVLVLITDGVPYPNADEQKAAAIEIATNELAKAAPAGPITTFAVGVGYTFPYAPTVYDQVFMGNLAQAGGAPNLPCDPNELTVDWNMCHFQVTPSGQTNPGILEGQFRAAIDKIRSKVTSCALKLEETGRIVDPKKVNVTFADSVTGVVTIFDQDAENGWTYDDPVAPTSVTLHGNSCKTLQDDPDGTLQVVLGCATLVK